MAKEAIEAPVLNNSYRALYYDISGRLTYFVQIDSRCYSKERCAKTALSPWEKSGFLINTHLQSRFLRYSDVIRAKVTYCNTIYTLI